jgi:hypothetical protein
LGGGARRREEEQLYKQAGLVTLRRKGVQLFQYIYYKDQLPLSLPPEVPLPLPPSITFVALIIWFVFSGFVFDV